MPFCFYPLKTLPIFQLFLCLALFCGARNGHGETPYSLSSPDRRLQMTLTTPVSGPTARPHWSVTFRNRELLSHCQLGLETVEDGDLMTGVSLIKAQRRSQNKTIPVVFGKSNQARDHFNELRCTFENAVHTRTEVIFRCYNDAIALRYVVPERPQSRSLTVKDEMTTFRVREHPIAYAQFLEHFKTSHEHNVSPVAYDDLKPNALLDMPLTLAWTNGACAAITEASLRHYAGMSLRVHASSAAEPDLVSQLTPRPDGTKVVRQLPLQTPWRVVLIGDGPGALLESETLYCLNEPSAIKDLSWIQPGKITFHWWNGDVYDGKPGLPALSLEMAKKYIDFCASNGIPTHSISSTEGVTSPWYFQSKPGVEPGPDTDVTRPRSGFDLPAIRDYARSKNVRLWTWVHQAALKGRVEEAFSAFEKLGWKGMMVDFFDHDDQDSVEFAESILEAAARHHIMIHLHGIWKPTGLERTYPNLMNHEGALNLEYLKWSDRCTPEHDLMMAFTRLVAGPMDYHLGGFRAVTRAEFKPRHVAPNVLGTRCHQLAMYVCFDNPNPMVADYPTAYEGQPGFDFIKLVPTWWDETRVLVGEIGEVLVTARRKGNIWYIGGLSAKTARKLELPLVFLNGGSYTARIWKDTMGSPDPNRLTLETLSLSKADKLKLQVAPDGGFVAQMIPDRR